MLFSAIPLNRRISWMILIFLGFGLMMLFSATAVVGTQRYNNEFYFVFRQAFVGAWGLVLMLALSRTPHTLYFKFAYVLLLVQILLIAATLFSPLAHEAQGAHRWIHLGNFLFQPSELAKITIPIFVGRLLAEHQLKPITKKKLFFSSLPVLALFALLIKQPDMGSTVLLAVTILGMLFVANVRTTYLAALVGIGAAGVAFLMLHADYRRRRLFAFLNPWADPQGHGFQSIQSFLSLHSGGIFGTGIGNGTSKLFYLPEVHTDFIFSLVGEELGFIGAMMLLCLLLYFVYCLFKVSLEARNTFACLLSFGISISFVLQIIVNLGGVTGLLPIKGLTLPFISWGRSALIVNLAMMGILLNILRTECAEK